MPKGEVDLKRLHTVTSSPRTERFCFTLLTKCTTRGILLAHVGEARLALGLTQHVMSGNVTKVNLVLKNLPKTASKRVENVALLHTLSRRYIERGKEQRFKSLPIIVPHSRLCSSYIEGSLLHPSREHCGHVVVTGKHDRRQLPVVEGSSSPTLKSSLSPAASSLHVAHFPQQPQAASRDASCGSLHQFYEHSGPSTFLLCYIALHQGTARGNPLDFTCSWGSQLCTNLGIVR